VNEYQDFRPPAAILADAPPAQLELASRWARLGATCLDGLTVGAVVVVAGIGGALLMPMLAGRHRDERVATAIAVVAGCGVFLALLALVVWNCVWLKRYGQTVGKRALRIRIVRTSGEPATLGRIFLLRFLPVTLLGAIPFLGHLLTLADLLLIFRDSRKCLHDQFADTIVVKAE
jgi:uncharacterized RDD family membrane protein YckC